MHSLLAATALVEVAISGISDESNSLNGCGRWSFPLLSRELKTRFPGAVCDNVVSHKCSHFRFIVLIMSFVVGTYRTYLSGASIFQANLSRVTSWGFLFLLRYRVGKFYCERNSANFVADSYITHKDLVAGTERNGLLNVKEFFGNVIYVMKKKWPNVCVYSCSEHAPYSNVDFFESKALFFP